MDQPDERPFVLEGEYASFGDAFPGVASLTVTVRAVSLAQEVERTRRYDERTLPSHAECPDCGHETAVGWYVAEQVEAGETEFEVSVPCRGLARVGRACPSGFRIEGSVEYGGG